MRIAILIFDGLTALDAIGPYEVLSRLPGAELDFVAAKPGVKRTDTGRLGLEADRSIAEVPTPDVILVPGGQGNRSLLQDEPVLSWLRSGHRGTRFTTSVCTGALVLGAAGILDGLRATTHWAYLDRLGSFGAKPTPQRVVEDGKVITAAGVSSGIDMALHLAAKLAGEEIAKAIQLGIEYDPHPPFDTGSPDRAPEHLVDAVRKLEDVAAPPPRPPGGAAAAGTKLV
jgi:transcriptional regulator GlxA family with amidase domain